MSMPSVTEGGECIPFLAETGFVSSTGRGTPEEMVTVGIKRPLAGRSSNAPAAPGGIPAPQLGLG